MLTSLNEQLGYANGGAVAPMPQPAAATPSLNAPPMVARPPTEQPTAPATPGMSPSQGIGDQMAAQGRGPDSMLVHMAPSEVSGLQALAAAHGGSMTTNPQTGLPEAGFLSSILPMVIGAALTPLTGGIINPMTAGLLVGAGTGIMKKDLGAGLMAGLSAYGGAGLGASLFGGGATAGLLSGGASKGAQAAQAANAAKTAGFNRITDAANALTNITPPAVPGVANAAGAGLQAASRLPGDLSQAVSGLDKLQNLQAPGRAGLMGAARGLPGAFAQNTAIRGLPGAATTGLATSGLMGGLAGAMTPGQQDMSAAQAAGTGSNGKSNYAGPYIPVNRGARGPDPNRSKEDSSEQQWFDTVNPFPAYTTASGAPPPGYPGGAPLVSTDLPVTPKKKSMFSWAEGGEVELKPGGFVMDARTVSELGNGNTDAGQALLARHGGQAINGKSGGVEDAVPAKIKGKRGTQPARVSAGEVKFSPEAVRKMGGPQRLYALMEKAQRARTVGRGVDSGLRRGLA